MTNEKDNKIEKEIFNNINHEIEDKENKKKEEDKNINDLIKKNLLSFLTKQLQEYNLKILEEKINFEKEKTKLKNRSEKEIEKNRKFCLEKIILSFIPAYDNIERALNLLKNKEKEENYIFIIEKLKYIFDQLEHLFQEYHVKKINDINTSFDPLIHEAMSIHYNNNIPSNQVVNIIQTGYILHNSRLLRPAMVIVSKKKK